MSRFFKTVLALVLAVPTAPLLSPAVLAPGAALLIVAQSADEAEARHGGGRHGGGHRRSGGHHGGGHHRGGGHHGHVRHHGSGNFHGGHHHDHHHRHHHHHRDDFGSGFVAGALTTLAIGAIVASIPDDCSRTTINGITYQDCGGTWYEPRYSGSDVTYIVVEDPR